MDEANENLRRALAVARTSPREALELLEASLEQARRKGDRRGIAILARHAGAVSSGSGDLHGAIDYYDEALAMDPEDAYLHFARGDVYRMLGQHASARADFTQSLELATAQGDADMIEMASQARASLEAPPSNDRG